MNGRLAIPVRELEHGARGVGRWLHEMLAAIAALGRDRDVVLYVERDAPASVDPGRFEVRATGPGPGGGAVAWEQIALSRALRSDRPAAVLGPANALPLFHSVPGVLVLHDLSFEVHPEWFSLREGARRRLLARASARRAHSILAVSDFTRREIHRLYRLSGPRVRVALNGVSARFQPITDAATLAAVADHYRLTGDIILAVGSLFNRRHSEELIHAIAHLVGDRPELQLVLVGDNRTHPRVDLAALAAAAGVADRVTWIESVPEDHLVALNSLARVAVYLSEYEGFGLPPLEAAACGTPVVASRTSALADNLEGHATLVSEHTSEAIAAAIDAVLASPPPRRERPTWLERFSWPAAAGVVLQALDDAAASAPPGASASRTRRLRHP